MKSDACAMGFHSVCSHPGCICECHVRRPAHDAWNGVTVLVTDLPKTTSLTALKKLIKAHDAAGLRHEWVNGRRTEHSEERPRETGVKMYGKTYRHIIGHSVECTCGAVWSGKGAFWVEDQIKDHIRPYLAAEREAKIKAQAEALARVNEAVFTSTPEIEAWMIRSRNTRTMSLLNRQIEKSRAKGSKKTLVDLDVLEQLVARAYPMEFVQDGSKLIFRTTDRIEEP